MTIVGLIGIAAGSFVLSLMPTTLGIPGYIAQRGIISGMLNLSHNLGLITGASVMGAVFARIGDDRHPGNPPLAHPNEASALHPECLLA
jgi:hypothetical protein